MKAFIEMHILVVNIGINSLLSYTLYEPVASYLRDALNYWKATCMLQIILLMINLIRLNCSNLENY